MKLKRQDLLKDAAYINGQWRKADSGEIFAVDNPATRKEIARVPDMGVKETKDAIAAAEKALPAWAASSAADRAKIMKKFSNLMIDNADDLAAIMTWEQGKPLSESKGEITYAASFIEWFAEEGKRAYGAVIPSPIKESRIVVIKQPVGVCAAITPWNFPGAMITRKLGPALGAGCTMVLKPAEVTPLSALALAALAEEAGLPAGVFNVVTSTDSKNVGLELCENPVVKKLSFTGSTEVGKILTKQCAGTLKKLSLELGGNAPFIVFDDADLVAAVDGAIASKYRNAGQTCVCANRILVQDFIYEKFAEMLINKVKALKVGDGFEDGVKIGPLINEEGIEKVEDHVKDALKKGAKLAIGGARVEPKSNFYQPTVLTDVTPDMKLNQEETFGPVAPLFRFKDEKDAIRLANDTIFGLAAYFYARDMGRVWRVSEALEYGMVAVNTGILSTEVAPFGGVKQSGQGREGSKYGLDEYMEIKYLLMAGINN